MRRCCWILVIGLVLIGCNQKYTILRDTSYRNPPEERIRILIMDFKNIDKKPSRTSEQMVEQAQKWFESEFALDYVESSIDAVQSPDAASPTSEQRKTKNPFIAVDRKEAFEKIKAAGTDLEKGLDVGDLIAIGKLDITDLVLMGSVGMAQLPRLDLMSPEVANKVVFGANRTVTVVRMGIIVADAKTGKVLLETRKQRRYHADADAITVMAREATGEILWTSFF